MVPDLVYQFEKICLRDLKLMTGNLKKIYFSANQGGITPNVKCSKVRNRA